jgi:hypothetical protein
VPLSPWTVIFTPYGWLTALNGDVTVKGRSVDINVDAFKVLGHLDAAPWMSYAEARRGASRPLQRYLLCQARHRRQCLQIRSRAYRWC